MNEKALHVAPPRAVPRAFPNTVDVFFSNCGANKILHLLHLLGLCILWSLCTRFTSFPKHLLEN